MIREDTSFPAGDARCAAWVYRPATMTGTVPCVVMAHGFSLTRHDGLTAFAETFTRAGFAVLVFDHRHLGDSTTGTPQRFRVAEQGEDWRSAIAFARGLDGVDQDRIALWGFSFSGGHVVNAAANDRRIAAALILNPFLDGLARVLGTPVRDIAWVLPRAVAERVGRPVRIPVTGPVGSHAAMAWAGEQEGFRDTVGEDSPWRPEIGPALMLTLPLFRPVSKARRLGMPIWVGVGERDITVSARAIERFAQRAPRAELHRYDADHFDPFRPHLASAVAADQVSFLELAL